MTLSPIIVAEPFDGDGRILFGSATTNTSGAGVSELSVFNL